MSSASRPLSRNIELKARVHDLSAARAVAVQIATHYVGVQRQLDTYFHATTGRLKLREIDSPPLAQLVWYSRPDSTEAKASDYRLVEIGQPAELKAALVAAYGIRVVVDKRREILLYENVRIHLDDVIGLGSFLEFEAVLDPTVDEARGLAQVAWLCEQFERTLAERIEGSYSDLLAALAPSRRS